MIPVDIDMFVGPLITFSKNNLVKLWNISCKPHLLASQYLGPEVIFSVECSLPQPYLFAAVGSTREINSLILSQCTNFFSIYAKFC